MNPQPPHSSKSLYLRFLKLAKAVSHMPEVADLKPSDAHLLQEIALHHFQDRTLRVSEVLDMKHLGSPATLHKRLVRLRSAGLLSVKPDDIDHRVKYLLTTPLAMRYFEHMGQAMTTAMQD